MKSGKAQQEEGLTASVRKWLLEQGFPLEMRVARTFKQAGFSVRQCVSYKDLSSGKAREIDVVAEARYEFEDASAGLRLSFIIECKRAATKPWILLSTPEAQSAGYNIFGSSANDVGNALLSNMELIDLPPEGMLQGPSRSAYSVTVAHKQADKIDDAYSACLAVVDALKGRGDIGTDFDSRFTSSGDLLRWAHITFPVIVIEGPLLDAHLDEAGDLLVSEVERGRIAWEIVQPGVPDTLIEIVREKELPDLLETLQQEVAAIKKACSLRPEILQEKSLAIKEELVKRFGRRTDSQ